MKIIIEKQYHKLGDEYMEQTEVEADVWKNESGDLLIEMEDSLYKLPNELLNGINNQKSWKDLDRSLVGQVKYPETNQNR